MIALIAVAAGLGALSRFSVDQWVQRRVGLEFPYGTLLVNTSGSLLLGFLVGLPVHEELLLVLGTGFAGGFTTLSTVAWETVILAEKGRLTEAAANLAISFGAGLLAAAAGFGLAQL